MGFGTDRDKTKRSAGYSLVELLIASAVMGVLLVGVSYSFGVQNEKYVVVDQVTEAQQNLRAVADLIERDVRRSGYMVPRAAAACAHDYTSQPDVLFLSDADTVRSTDELSANAPALLAGNLGISIVSLGSTSLKVPKDPNPQLKIDEGANSGFAVGGGVIIVDRNDPNSKVACAEITAINDDTLTLDFGNQSYSVGAAPNDLVAIPALVYKIVPASAGDPSHIQRNGLLLAYDVEDLQLVFYFDDDGDGIRDNDDEVFGDATGAGSYPPPASPAVDMASLREVEVNVITVTRDDAPGDRAQNISKGQTTANRNPSSVTSPDRRMRRLQKTTVRMRNVG